MPESAVHLLFVLGVVLVVGGMVRPHRLGNAAEPSVRSAGERLRFGLRRYRLPGLIIGALVAGMAWYAASPESSPDVSTPQAAAQPQNAGETGARRRFESDFIEIELPAGWTAKDVFGLRLSDLHTSQLPRAHQVSIFDIPMKTEDLHLFAFDGDHRATLVVLATGTDAGGVPRLLDQRWALYTWNGVPVAETQENITMNGKEAGTMVLEPMHRFELFREKQYLVAGGERTYTLIFSTPASSYGENEPLFEEIASSFRVLSES